MDIVSPGAFHGEVRRAVEEVVGVAMFLFIGIDKFGVRWLDRVS